MESKELWASKPGLHARYGVGQYLTDLAPEQFTREHVSNQLFRRTYYYKKLRYFIEIDVTGLNVQMHRENVFLIPGLAPLDISNRVVRSGVSVFKTTF
ncbi:MAG: hypothetical protein HDR80_00185 [Bacteroides sp.]|nr:hypothetical protein [Bacteroides sp.]